MLNSPGTESRSFGVNLLISVVSHAAKSTTLDKEVIKSCSVSLPCITALRYVMSAAVFTELSVRVEHVTNAVDPLRQVVVVAGRQVVRTAVTGAT